MRLVFPNNKSIWALIAKVIAIILKLVKLVIIKYTSLYKLAKLFSHLIYFRPACLILLKLAHIQDSLSAGSHCLLTF